MIKRTKKIAPIGDIFANMEDKDIIENNSNLPYQKFGRKKKSKQKKGILRIIMYFVVIVAFIVNIVLFYLFSQ